MIDATFLIRWQNRLKYHQILILSLDYLIFDFTFLYIESDHERATFTDFAFDTDRTTMSFHKVLADGKSQTATLYFCSRHTEIVVENTFVVTQVNALSEVLDIDLDGFVDLSCTDDDPPVLR